MAERVEIIVTAQDTASQILRGVGGAFGGIQGAIQNLTSGQGILALTEQIVQFGKQSVEATVAYANEVRSLTQISGQSAEETSRLIQLADDFKISTGDLTVAMRKMTSEGLSLNVKTLAQLSDEYLKLNPGQERAAFLMDKFGRQGVKFAEIMGKGSSEILKLNDGIDDNLILTDKAIAQAREYEKAMDGWEEQTQKLSYALGTKALPILTSLTKEANKRLDEGSIFDAKRMIPVYGAWLQLSGLWESTTNVINGMNDETDSATQSYEAMARATAGLNAESEKTPEELKAIAEQEKAVSDAMTDLIGLIGNMQSAEDTYTEKSKDLAGQRAEAENNLRTLRAQGYGEQSEQIQGALGKLEEIKSKEAELATEYEKQTLQFEADMLRQELARDGWTKGEEEAFQKQMIAWGLWSQDAVDKANAVIAKAKDTAAAIDAIPTEHTTNINIYTNEYGQRAAGAAAGRASGGDVSAGQMYRVNETNQEYFRPNTGGYIVPLAPAGESGGATVNIYADAIIGDERHVMNYLLPMIREGVRQVGAGR